MSDVPASPKKIQQEEVKYKSGVSEATLFKMAGSMNYLLQAFFPVGTILMSMLDEATFNAQIGTVTGNWKLCNGQTCVGSAYETLTSNGAVPDLRGRYPRGKDNGAGLTPEGELATGTTLGDEFASHNHTHQYFKEDPAFNATHWRWQKGAGDSTLTTSTDFTGSAETRPKTTIVNFMIRID